MIFYNTINKPYYLQAHIYPHTPTPIHIHTHTPHTHAHTCTYTCITVLFMENMAKS